MYRIRTLNAISSAYKKVLRADEYTVSADEAAPDAVIVRSADMHAAALPESLLAVGRAGTGCNNIPTDEYARRGIVVFNTPGANANAVKELTLAALLLSSRDILGGIEWCASLKAHGAAVPKLIEQGKHRFAGPELSGKTLGVFGLGGIGGAVANAAADLGMKVLGFDPYISVDNAWRLSRNIVHASDAAQLCSCCDYISLHIPLREDTRGSFDARFFGRMKQGAVLLNLSRGELVNDADVLAALAGGRLRRYVTDFPNAALIGSKNVITIPHLGASTPESEDHCVEMVCRRIDEYLRFGSIRNSVNYPTCELAPNTLDRISVLHANVPSVISSISAAVAAAGLNIDGMTNKSRGEFACSVLDVNGTVPPDLTERIRSIGSVFRVRLFRASDGA